MSTRNLEHDPLPGRLKQLVADLFRLDILEADTISDDEPLIGGELGLDSLDALELAMCIEEEFGIVMGTPQESPRAFANITNLATFIHARTRSIPGLAQNRLLGFGRRQRMGLLLRAT